MRQLYRWLGLLSTLIVFAACSASEPVQKTNTPVSTTALSTSAPVAETPVAIPTVTPTQVFARLRNLRFSTSDNAADAQPAGMIFDAGQQAMYAVVDYADWPANTPVQVEVRRNGVDLSPSNQPWTEIITGTGTVVIPLITDSRQLIPQAYDTTIQAGNETLQGIFRVSAVDGKPGTILVSEIFGDNPHGLAQWQSAESSGAVKDGYFQMTTGITSYVTKMSLPIGLADFDATFEVQRDPATPDAIVGLAFRDDEHGAYVFEVAGDGTWLFGTDAPSLMPPFYLAKSSGVIGKGEAVNQFRVIGQGNRFTFYANGVKLREVVDGKSQFTFGRVALIVRSPTGKPVTARFDNVSVALPATLLATTGQSISPSSLTTLAAQLREAVQAVYQIDAWLHESRLDLSAAACAEIMPRFYQATSWLITL